jgi:hypothetical protein
VAGLARARVRFVVMGVQGVNHYARSAGMLFTTQDYDLFLPPSAANELRAWKACRALGADLWCGGEPLGAPLDLFLARRIVDARALVRAESEGLQVDLSLTMADFKFQSVWRRRRVFKVEGVGVPVARLADIVASKAAAGRPKDRLFLATHEEALRGLLAPARRRRASARSAPRRGR